MYQRILVAYDGSDASRLAIDECAHLTPVAGREVHVACVIHDPSAFVLPGEFVPEPLLDSEREDVQQDLDRAAAALRTRGFTVSTHLLDGEPVDVLAKLIESLAIDLLVVGHRRSKKFAARWWRGRIDALLIERVRCAILVAGEPPKPTAG
ncbi:MAG TPA: universal stress protein [Casimicrobiaceae bacterium]|jgi:nucleotide-binding universal stress UspA family protein|nr:universal stress protein [Casimicrobiaceae bacterium]